MNPGGQANEENPPASFYPELLPPPPARQNEYEYGVLAETQAGGFVPDPHGSLVASSSYPISPDSGYSNYPMTPLGVLTPLSGPLPVAPEPHQVPPANPVLNRHHSFAEQEAFNPHESQTQWALAAAQTNVWVDGQLSNMPLGFVSPSPAGMPYESGLSYIQPFDAAQHPYGSSSVPDLYSPAWGATPPSSLPMTMAAGHRSVSHDTASQSTGSQPTKSQGTGSQSTSSVPNADVKPKRKRGRPRLYDDNGVEIPKRKPGRPPTYAVEPEPLGSVPSYRLFRSSSSAAESSTASSLLRSGQGPQTSAWSPPTNATSSGSGSGSGSGSRSGSIAGANKVDEGKGKRKGKATDMDIEDVDGGKQATIRARNKVAATRYRAKTQAAIATMEAEEREVRLQREALLACAGELRDELFQLKNEVMRHAQCGCPLITSYLSNVARQTLATHQGDQPFEGISGNMDGLSLDEYGEQTHVIHIESCSQNDTRSGQMERA